MAFLASNAIPQDVYQRTKRTALNLKQSCQDFVVRLAAANATYTMLRDIYITLTNANAFFDAVKAVPGLADYAAAQENDPTYDVAAEFVAMQAAITAAQTWMEQNIPTNVTAVAPANWAQNGPMIATEFPPAQTSNLRAALNGVVSAIS